MIEKLTPEQELRLSMYRDEWIKIGQSVHPCDDQKTKQLLTSFYKRIGKPAPRFLVFDSPHQACIGAPIFFDLISGAKPDPEKNKKLSETIMNARYAQRWWCGWVAFYQFCKEIGVPYAQKDAELLQEWDELSRACHWFFPFENYCILSRGPTVLTVDGQNRLHGPDKMAIQYADGWGFHYWHGIKVPADVIEDKPSVTVARIEAEENSEVRRAMIEVYGSGRYLLESGAEEIQRDEFGVLLRKGELLSVRVCNSTPEPDGTLSKKDVLKIFGRPRWMGRSVPPDARFKEYFLDVHPDLCPMLDETNLGKPQKLTARNAVASTFGLRGEEYAPELET